MGRIGILGGTFDPIHLGHLILAEQAWELLELEKVLFIPAADPPHKAGRPVLESEHRYEMVRLAVQGNDHFECSRREMDRPGPSYTVDTLEQLHADLPGDTQLYLIVGADEAQNLMKWRTPYAIKEFATIVVANRPGLTARDVIDSLPSDFSAGIIALKIPGVEISSTNIREQVTVGRTVKYLVPDAVENYIRTNGLYRGKR